MPGTILEGLRSDPESWETSVKNGVGNLDLWLICDVSFLLWPTEKVVKTVVMKSWTEVGLTMFNICFPDRFWSEIVGERLC